jgi:LPPG:FO 2-phospho-L-lactate transferase
MMAELGLGSDALAIARFYAGLIDGLVIDQADAAQARPIEALGVAPLVAPTVMNDLDDRIALAGRALAFARGLRGRDQARHWSPPAVVGD